MFAGGWGGGGGGEGGEWGRGGKEERDRFVLMYINYCPVKVNCS